MSNHPRKAGRGKAQTPAMTRRQHKRARKPRQQPAPASPRRATPPPATAPATTVPSPAASAARASRHPRSKPRVPALEPEVSPAQSGVTAIEAAPHAATSPAPSRRAVAGGRASAEAPASAAPRAGVRKFPTLAQMVAIAPRTQPTQAMAPEPAMAGGRPDLSEPEAPREPTALEGRDVSTAPLAATLPKARRAATTRRLSTSRMPGAAATPEPAAAPTVEPPRAKAPRGMSVAPGELLVPISVIHAGVAAVAAVVGAALLLLDRHEALWPLSLMVIAGLGGWLAYVFTHRLEAPRLAGALLLASQLGALGWLMALLGPRVSLLALVPFLMLLSLRTAGRSVAVAAVLGALALYAAFAVLTLQAGLQPALDLPAGLLLLLDGLIAAAGLIAALLVALALSRRQQRAETAARARQHEARVLRARASWQRQQMQDDAARLEEALATALRGQGIARVEASGALSPVAEAVNDVADRLATLQRDREERLRLEGAVRRLTQAVERDWLGLPWTWPEWSGTPVDDLLALLRSPRPQQASLWPDDTPTLIPIPTAQAELPRTPSSPLPSTPEPVPVRTRPSVALPPIGWDAAASAQAVLESSLHPAPPQLPWREWDQWSDKDREAE
jgi:hypothetical protein